MLQAKLVSRSVRYAFPRVIEIPNRSAIDH